MLLDSLDFLLVGSGELSGLTGNLTVAHQTSTRQIGQALRLAHNPDAIAVARFPHLPRNLLQVSMIMRHALSCAFLTEPEKGPLDYRSQLAEYAQEGRPTIVVPMSVEDLLAHLRSLNPGFGMSIAELTATVWRVHVELPDGRPDQAIWAAPEQLLVLAVH